MSSADTMTAATTLAPPSKRPAPEARFVLVTGGKGGVGKTTVAANLAVALARVAAAQFPRDPATPDLHPLDLSNRGSVTDGVRKPTEAPLLVDLDLGLANLDLLLNLEKGPGLESYLCGSGTIEEALVTGPQGVGVLTAGSGIGELARPDEARRTRLAGGIRELSRRFGIIVGDSPAGIGPDVLGFAALADRVLVVTTPEPAAMTDAYGLMKALDFHARENGVEVPTPELFVNLATDAVEARHTAERLAGVCQRFLARSPRLVGWMPRSRLVLKSVLERVPIVVNQPRSLPAKSMERLARRFSGLIRERGLEPAL